MKPASAPQFAAVTFQVSNSQITRRTRIPIDPQGTNNTAGNTAQSPGQWPYPQSRKTRARAPKKGNETKPQKKKEADERQARSDLPAAQSQPPPCQHEYELTSPHTNFTHSAVVSAASQWLVYETPSPFVRLAPSIRARSTVDSRHGPAVSSALLIAITACSVRKLGYDVSIICKPQFQHIIHRSKESWERKNEGKWWAWIVDVDI